MQSCKAGSLLLLLTHMPLPCCRAVVARGALGPCAVATQGNSHFNGGSIMHLQGLTGLRQLRWHVGDLLDYPPTAAALKVGEGKPGRQGDGGVVCMVYDDDHLPSEAWRCCLPV